MRPSADVRARGTRSLFGNRDGIAIVEFALVLPVLVLLMLGISQVGTAIVVDTKVRNIASTVGQIASQYTTIRDADMALIFGAANAIVSPYPTSPLSVVVTQVAADGTGSGTVVWSSAFQTSGRGIGARVPLPNGMGVAATYFVLTESRYNFVPMIGTAFVGTVALNKRVFAASRSGGPIVRTP